MVVCRQWGGLDGCSSCSWDAWKWQQGAEQKSHTTDVSYWATCVQLLGDTTPGGPSQTSFPNADETEMKFTHKISSLHDKVSILQPPRLWACVLGRHGFCVFVFSFWNETWDTLPVCLGELCFPNRMREQMVTFCVQMWCAHVQCEERGSWLRDCVHGPARERRGNVTRRSAIPNI